jgi:hypothetical protein
MKSWNPLKPVVIIAFLVALSGCVAGPRFEWGSYETALYQYSKSPDKLPQYQLALQTAITQGKVTNRLAPGLQAELGYTKLEEGKTAEAVILFREEVAAFPESGRFLSPFIDRLVSPSVSTPAPVAPAAPAAPTS